MTFATAPLNDIIRTFKLMNVPAMLATSGYATNTCIGDVDMSIVTEKRCKRCGETKPLSEFKKEKRRKDGFSTWCKPCHNAVARDWYNNKYVEEGKTRAPIYTACSDCGKPKITKVERRSRRCRSCYEASQEVFSVKADGTKRCTKCYEVKPVSEFYGTVETGLMGKCISCLKEYGVVYRSRPETKEYFRSYNKDYAPRRRELAKAFRDANPELARQLRKRRKLIERYGMTLEDYEVMYQEQGGICAICGNKNKLFNNILYVDHDHETGAIRGLLCNNCNSALGLIHDNTDLVLKLYDYLIKSKEMQSLPINALQVELPL